MSAESINRSDASVDLVFGLDALHHVRDPQAHFKELVRVLKPGGRAIFIEPNWNLFSKFCFKYLLKYLHPEPYDTKKKDWKLDDPDPMMGNQSQAHNIFIRDAEIFQQRYPQLTIEILDPIKAISFLLSGGVHTRLPIPSRLLVALYRAENRHPRWLQIFGLGRLIRISKSVSL
jgi:SAM-dependent methyltransferase